MMTTIKILSASIVFLWMVLLTGLLLYRFDGEWFPVASTLRFGIDDIERYYERPGGWSLIAGEFDKYRNCEYKGIEWHLVSSTAEGVGEGEVQVLAEFEDAPIIRSKGNAHTFKRLAVRLFSEEDILERSRVVVVHDCYYGLLWKTRTEFVTPKNG